MRAALFLLCAPLVFGQLDTNTVSVTATRSVVVQADQAVFVVSVASPLDATLDDMVGALQGTGITAAQFSGVAAPQSTNVLQFQIVWTFVVPVPLANMKTEIATLTTARQSLMAKRSAFTLSFNVAGTQASPELLAAQPCSRADLIADATAQAQKMAAAGGFWLGAIVSMSDVQAGVVAVPTQVIRTGDFSFLSGGTGTGDVASFLVGIPLTTYAPLTSPRVSCSMTVKFRVTK